MVLFIHTADWHIGKKNKQLGEVAKKVRDQRLKTGEEIIEKAEKEEVDFIIISGDLFEDNTVDRDTVEEVIDILSGDINTYILPGNHDPLKEGSVYYYEGWESKENIHIFKDEKPLKHNDHVKLFPCPIKQKKSNSDPTSCIPDSVEDDCIRIGIAHGTLDIGISDNPNFPINKNRAKETNLDYLALGEWHSWNTFEDDIDVENTVYPSSPEPTKKDDRDPGNIALVEIQDSEVKIEKEKVSSLKWADWTQEITDSESVDDLERKISDLENPEKTILSIDVNGVVSPDAYNSIENLEENEDILSLKIRRENLFIEPDLEEMVGVVPPEFREIIEDLTAIMSKDPEMIEHINKDPSELKERIKDIDERNLDINNDPELAKNALSIIYRYSKEVER